MTKIINLYGGPGTGKSTSAAYLYYRLKELGKNVELVREYVKDWAWENRHISEYDQFYFMGKQMRRESMLYGKVDYIVTDAPVAMNCLYADKYCSTSTYRAVAESVLAYWMAAQKEGQEHLHVFLERTKRYNPNGRFQTEEEAKKLDLDLGTIFQKLYYKALASKMKLDVKKLGTTREELDNFITTLLTEEE